MRQADREDGMGCFLLAVALALSIVLLRWCDHAAVADAQDRPHADLAVALVAESDGQRSDDAAILHLLSRRCARTGRSIDAEARAYCAIWRVRHPTERQQAILARSPEYERDFARAEADIALWEAGQLDDPCPGADHFGSPHGEDYQRAVRLRWLRVSCRARTLNVFWRLPGGHR